MNYRMPARKNGYGVSKIMHKVTCKDCGKETEVPFKPNPEEPVYCKECFRKHRQY